MSALNILREIKTAARRIGYKQKLDHQNPHHTTDKASNTPIDPSISIQWGNFDYIMSINIDMMSRRELRHHLEARDLSSVGTRVDLIKRLKDSLSEEEHRTYTKTESVVHNQTMIQADIEERGSVYACGSNSKGELGLGDLLPRRYFMPIPSLRGVGVVSVVAGVDLCFAITHEHDVYVWGGGGYGRTGIISSSYQHHHNKYHHDDNGDDYLNPRIIVDMVGEECNMMSVGLSHNIAIGRGGDCFVWGENDVGQLGMDDVESRVHVTIHPSFPSLQQVSCGANHSAAVYPSGAVYVWGHASNGRLGIGSIERHDTMITYDQHHQHDDKDHKRYYAAPQHLKTLEPIRQVSCGADHTLAIGPSGAWAWGSGAGGKLGLGDTKDRHDPCLIPKLAGKFILQLAAGTWHSMVLIAYPPMRHGGYISSWGSGYHGQLAQGSTQVSLYPTMIDYFLSIHILIKHIAIGSHHCAAITVDDELYTWGSNNNGCLGRMIPEVDVLYTAVPGYVSGFGAMVGRSGRGLVRSVSCGKEFTVVATYPYTGPDMMVAMKLMDDAKVREQETMLAKKAEQQFHDTLGR